ncbi:barstar family protein [Umezawaea sp. Da 62-37]|uniref:barstar family protein n=1 Tax=Umezawaea sp. Da 62-37 TaxID=3075927 RepID=UPI0028F6FBD4|nr:barstar family protein [Umezawaea sp. Da 62-37]WNV89366.1 barstar family protein [Umezawaea sp. Da 62-37]
MSEDDLASFRRWILAVLDTVAADPLHQVRYLRDAGVGVDELLLELDDAVVTAQARWHDKLLLRHELNLIELVGAHVDAMTESSAPLWTEEALAEASEWRELRQLATDVRTELARSWVEVGSTTVLVDGTTIRTEGDLHDLLSHRLNFGPHYTATLEALWRRLSSDLSRPVELVWRASATSRRLLGSEAFDRIRSVLTSVADRDARFTVRFE